MTTQNRIPFSVILASAAVAGVGSTVVAFPFDLLKTRQQMYGRLNRDRIAIYPLMKIIYHSDGISGFYNGLSASCLRQVVFSGTRTALFQLFIDISTDHGVNPSFAVRSAVGISSGVIAGAISLPADVIMTRMAADGHEPLEKRRNYKGLTDAFLRIIREEGAGTLYRGLSVTCFRAAIVNATQLVSYLRAKEFILLHNIMDDNAYCHSASSIFSAFCTAFATLPADIAKTRIQNMRIVNGKGEYTGVIDVWWKITTSEGIFALWKGFTPMFVRNVPQFLVFFVLYEQCILLYKRFS